MAVAKITKTVADKLGAGEVVWDTAVKGFGIRRHTTNDVFYLLRYRLNGKQTFYRIGTHGSGYTPDTARKKAQEELGRVAAGIDIAKERKNQRNAKRSTMGFGVEAERYLAMRKPTLKLRSYLETERHLLAHAKPLHGSSLVEIDRRVIAQRLGEIETASGPAARNRVRSSLSAFFAWAVKEGLLNANPVAGTGKAEEGGSRERVLTPAELTEMWAVLPQDHFGDIVRLLMLTGQRREEIGALRWSEVDLARGLIVLRPERTKNKRTHQLPLSLQARAVLERQIRRNSRDLIFGIGEGGFSGWSDCKARLDKAILDKRREKDCRAKAIPDWQLHDLRRTAATGMAELGVLPHIIEAVLNHVSGHKGGVAGVYNRALYESEMREALAKWADYIDGITRDTGGAIRDRRRG
jgi:integrase